VRTRLACEREEANHTAERLQRALTHLASHHGNQGEPHLHEEVDPNLHAHVHTHGEIDPAALGSE
jgi:hypothetical protein